MDHSDPFELDEALVGTLLREELADASLDWDRFGAEVMARLDQTEAAGITEEDVLDPVLRADEVDPEEWAAARLIEGLPPVWVAALRREAARELAAVEGRFARFGSEVWARVDEIDHADATALERPVLGELLRADVRAELGRRQGDWVAFSTQLEARLVKEARAEEARPLEERAVAELRREVEHELSEMAPRFENAFSAQVEARMNDAEATADWWSRLRGTVRRAFSLEEGGFGLAASAAAAALLILWTTTGIQTPRSIGPSAELAGSVSVEEVSFEGSVAVMPQGEVTVVFLSEAPEV